MAKQARARVFNITSKSWDWTGWYNVSDETTREDYPYGVEFREKPKLKRVVKIDENDSISYLDIERVKEYLEYWINEQGLSFTLMFEMDSND